MVVGALGCVSPVMEPGPTAARRRCSLPPWLPLGLLLWSGLALGALPFGSSPHRVFHDLLSEQQLLEVEDLSLSLLQGGRLGPLSLPPDLPDLDPECRELLLDFANSSAELTGCLVRSARPVRLCQTCYPPLPTGRQQDGQHQPSRGGGYRTTSGTVARESWERRRM